MQPRTNKILVEQIIVCWTNYQLLNKMMFVEQINCLLNKHLFLLNKQLILVEQTVEQIENSNKSLLNKRVFVEQNKLNKIACSTNGWTNNWMKHYLFIDYLFNIILFNVWTYVATMKPKVGLGFPEKRSGRGVVGLTGGRGQGGRVPIPSR